MAHRGRLNVLANILRKPYEEIFAQFEENYLPDSMDGDGDVKYHLGFSSDRVNSRGQQVHLSLTPNPSHLEAVDPVVEGRTRAKQTAFGDTERKQGVPLLIHGDAAFAGQGLVAETLNLSQLAGYTTGGTIHVIVNNQIGFTTSPQRRPLDDVLHRRRQDDPGRRSSTSTARIPRRAVYVAELALEFRQTFNCDVVIDMFCYRQHGHNEGDDPSFTQPVMYDKIKNRPTLTSSLHRPAHHHRRPDGRRGRGHRQEVRGQADRSRCTRSSEGPPEYATMHGFDGRWHGLTSHYSHAPVETGVAEETLRSSPRGWSASPTTSRSTPSWRRSSRRATRTCWTASRSTGRSPSCWRSARCCWKKTPVRLSGQDSRRGTFSQRHAVLFDYEHRRSPTSPLNHLRPEQAAFQVYDSLLSEAAVLGFEFGYSLDAPDTLVLWEAQFGDFANGAQVIIDQFIASSESKWQRDSGLVMLLPHGYEGQGPEHSSARLERFLQLCADDNMQVCICRRRRPSTSTCCGGR